MGQFSQKIRCCRGDQNRIRAPRQIDMGHGATAVGTGTIPQAGPHRPPGQGLKSHRADETRGRLGHRHIDARAGLDQQTSQFGRLVGRDATGNAQDETLADEFGHDR